MGKDTKIVAHEGTGLGGYEYFHKCRYGKGCCSILPIGYPLPSLDGMERVDLFCHHYSSLSINKIRIRKIQWSTVGEWYDIQQMLHHPNQPPNLYNMNHIYIRIYSLYTKEEENWFKRKWQLHKCCPAKTTETTVPNLTAN
jgi:hypothetical protein